MKGLRVLLLSHDILLGPVFVTAPRRYTRLCRVPPRGQPTTHDTCWVIESPSWYRATGPPPRLQ